MRLSFASVRTRLLLLVFVALIPAIALIFYNLCEHCKHEAADAREEALELARRAAFDEEKALEGARHLVTALAQSPTVRDGDAASCNPLFVRVLRLDPAYANLAVVGRHGDLLYSGVALPRSVNVADRAWFQQALRARGVIASACQRSRVTGRPGIVVALPVRDSASRVRCVVCASLDLAGFARLTRRTRLPRGSMILALDKSGTILAGDRVPLQSTGRLAAESPALNTILSQRGEGTAELAGPDGVSRLWSFARVRLVGDPITYLAVGIPMEVAFAEPARTFAINLGLFALAMALVFTAAWTGSDVLILRRVKGLLSATQALAAGDLAVRTGLAHGRDELAQLACAFDEMAASLERHERQLRRTQAALVEGEARYRRLFETVPQPMWVYDTETLEFLAVNEAAMAHYGYTREEFLRMSAAEIRPAEDNAKFRASLRALGPETERLGIWRHRLKDGRLIDVEVISHGLAFSGHPARLVLAIDITARKQAEEQQQRLVTQLRELARRVQAVREEERSATAREVHDELGQALTGLKMDLAWLKNRLVEAEDGAARRPALERVAAMSGLVDTTVHTVRRIASELRPGVLDAVGLVAAIAWQARDFQERTGIACEAASAD